MSKTTRTKLPNSTIIRRPSVSLIARKAAGRIIVRSGLRAGAEARAKNPGT
jgi:hypothetical protein